MRRCGLFGLAIVAVVTIGCGAAHVGTASSAVTGVAGPSTVVPTSAPPASAASSARPQDQGFTVVAMQLKQDPLGFFGGTVEVQNTGKRTHTAAMRFTFKANGKFAGTADAFANSVAVGRAVTVDLLSTDKWDGGPVTYSFQVTSLY